MHAKCRYCGNSWFPFSEKAYNPPVDAAVKCPKCKSKQHLHWIESAAPISRATGPTVFPSLTGVDFEQKKVTLPKIENPETNVPSTKNAPDIAPLPELKEKSQPKQEARPIFKARMSAPAAKPDLRPIFKASTRIQSKTLAKPEPLSQPRPEFKPASPAPIREIKIEDEPEAGQEPKESKPFEIHETERHELKVEPELGPKAEPEPKQEERSMFKASSPEKLEPEVLPLAEIKPEAKVEEQPAEKSEPRSMFKSSSFKSTVGSSPRPLFKSHLRRELNHESRPPVEIPEVKMKPEQSPKIESEPKREVRAERLNRLHSRRESLFPAKKAEVEVRESPLDDEPELEKVPEKKEKSEASEQKPAFSSAWLSRKKPGRKLSENPDELEDSDQA